MTIELTQNQNLRRRTSSTQSPPGDTCEEFPHPNDRKLRFQHPTTNLEETAP